jgi:penicillin amidase
MIIEKNDTTNTAGSHLFGITMPGVPFLVMGKNRKISLGFTYGFGDYYDYYIEEIRDGKYRSNEDTWEPLEQVQHMVHTKSGEDLQLMTYWTSNGILDLDIKKNDTMSPPPPEGFYLSRANALSSEHLALGMSSFWRAADSSSALEAAEHASRICVALNFVIAGTFHADRREVLLLLSSLSAP